MDGCGCVFIWRMCVSRRQAFPPSRLGFAVHAVTDLDGQPTPRPSAPRSKSPKYSVSAAQWIDNFFWDLHWVCVGNRDGFDFGSLGEFNWWDSWEMPCNIETSMTRRPLWSLILDPWFSILDPRSWSLIRAHHPGSFTEMFWRRSSLENWRMKR